MPGDSGHDDPASYPSDDQGSGDGRPDPDTGRQAEAPESVGVAAAPTRSGRSRLAERRRRRRRRRIVWGVSGAAILVVLVAAWVGFRVWQAYGHLQAAATMVEDLQDQIESNDVGTARSTMQDLQQETAAARSAAHDPLWSAASHLPWVGPNLDAVRIVADSLDDLSQTSAPPLLTIADLFDSSKLAPHDGAIDLTPLRQAGPPVTDAAAEVKRIRGLVDGIDRGALFGPVDDAVGRFDGKLGTIDGVLDTASRAVQLLPPMLGADGERTYLVAFQNPAELRTTGGIFGAYAVLHAADGRITMGDQGSGSGSLGSFDPPVMGVLSDEQVQLFTDRPAIYPMDVNLIPDFPTAAQLLAAMYSERFGIDVDGVIATDPVALADVLGATGPIDLPNGDRLTAANAVQYLLADAYVDTTPEESDELFATAARAVFATLISGTADPHDMLAALRDAAGERRLLVWSSDDDEQTLLAPTPLSGQLPEDDAAGPVVGVFLNDGTGGKMDYYLRQKVSLEATGCSPDRELLLEATVTLTTSAPASGLPDYVTGMAMGGEAITRTNVQIVAPVGGDVDELTLDGKRLTGFHGGQEAGRTILITTVDLAPGESKTVRAVIRSGTLADGASGIELRTTPMAHPSEVTVGALPGCAARGH